MNQADLSELRGALISLIREFLEFRIDGGSLSNFAWTVIEIFSSELSELPEETDFEREFWYAIWQIQHLGGEASDAMLREQMVACLDYLEGTRSLPTEYNGRRP
jgi:hypothetical protein